MLDHFGSFGVIFGSLWDILGHFWPFLGHFVAFLDKFPESSIFLAAPLGSRDSLLECMLPYLTQLQVFLHYYVLIPIPMQCNDKAQQYEMLLHITHKFIFSHHRKSTFWTTNIVIPMPSTIIVLYHEICCNQYVLGDLICFGAAATYVLCRARSQIEWLVL